jgi:lipopolysaccharide/colanic/teichoic acid biosynthesis glycosyltransferase
LQPTLVVGPPSSISGVQHRLKTFPETGLRFEGSYSPRPSDFATPQSRQALVDRLAMSPRVKHVLCLVQDVDEPVFKDLVRFADSNVEVSVVLPLARLFAAHTRSHLGDLGLLPIHFRASWGSSAAKRAVDIVGSLILIALLSPVLLATAIAIRTGDPGPAIFRQRRVGKDGQTFTIFKFRSMVVDAEARRDDYMARNVNRGLLFKVENDPRVTPVGAIIRRLSIDELPQLFNVFQGDMSLVGPRPLPVDPDDFDVAAQIRHRVLPGITGLWQIKGANALSYSDMLDLDLTYVATHSFGVDLVILLRTIPAVLIRRAPY